MIRMNQFKAEPALLRQRELAATERVLRSGWFILGKETDRFETEWARFCNAKHAVGVANGLEALEIGLRCLEIGAGDEVITTPMTAMATTLAIIRAGAIPVFADICPETALLDPSAVASLISSRTKAVLLVHLYGQIRDMNAWRRLCRKHSIHLLEDCAQSHGARWNEQMAGTFGSWGAYSFYPTKNLGAKGDAGMLITQSEQIAARAKRLRNYGQENRYEHREFGLNSRLDELQSALLSVRLKWLNKFNARRQQIAQRYHAEISNPRIQLLAQPVQAENHVYHLFAIRCQERTRLMEHLKHCGIESLVHYPIPIHQQPCAKVLTSGPLPCAEEHAATCLSIPCHPQLTDKEQTKVIRTLNAFR